MTLKYVKRGFNYSQDGPGNRLVYHLYGCNLRCPWCANPETVFPGLPFENITPAALAKEAMEASPIMFEGGGVTFTGGEPTVQWAALTEALRELKNMDIDTCIESNATHKDLPLLFPLLDHIILDFKHYNDEKHCIFTGLSNKVIKENIRRASASGKDLIIRTPLIGGVNSSDEDADGFLAFYRELDTTHVKFELLQYHEYGKPKWEKLDKPYLMEHAQISKERVLFFEQKYRQNGLTVIRT